MNIHEAYTIYNNSLKTMNPQLAEAIDRIIDNKALEIYRLRKALELYADDKVWREPYVYTDLVDGEPEEVKDAPWAILDGGDYARKVLEGDKQ